MVQVTGLPRTEVVARDEKQLGLDPSQELSPPETERPQAHAPMGLRQSLSKLQSALDDAKEQKKEAESLKRPAAVESTKSLHKQASQSRAAAQSSQQTAKTAKVTKATMKRPAASSSASSGKEPSPVPKGHGKKLPSKVKRQTMSPNGCSSCRFVPGHTPSCWIKKGWKP